MPEARKRARNQKALLRLPAYPTILLLMVVAFLFRIMLMHYRFAVTFDEVNYLKLGVSGHLKGLSQVLHTYWTPLLPALISVSCSIFSDYELAGRMVSILAGTLLVVPVYYLGKFVYDKTVGLIAAGFVALFPPLAFQSTQVLTEPVFMLFATSAILFGLLMLKRYSVGFAMLAGLATGILYLTHPQGFGYFLLIAFWILFGAATRLFLIKPLRALWMIVPFVLLSFGLSAPYLLYLKHKTGTWTLSAKASANQQFESFSGQGNYDPFRAWDPEKKIVPIDLIYHQGTFLNATDGEENSISEVHFGPFLKKYVKNVYTMLKSAIPSLLTLFPLMLLGVGLVGSRWKNQQGKLFFFLLSFIAFFWFGIIPAFHITERYLTPLLPVCAIWVAAGAVQAHSWLQEYHPLKKVARKIKLRPEGLAAVALVAAFAIFSFLPELGRIVSRRPGDTDFWADPVEQKQAGLWLKENASGAKIIMSRNHAVDFYAGSYDITQSVTIPTSDLQGVLEYAKYRGVNYIVLNERYESAYPDLRELFQTEQPIPGLRLIYNKKYPAQLITKIYRLTGELSEN
ncbi:MAG: ArnT family glycosyltransferase [bacterium]